MKSFDRAELASRSDLLEVRNCRRVRELTLPKFRLVRQSWDRPGLEKLVLEAAARLESAVLATGEPVEGFWGRLPWNLPAHGPWVRCRRVGPQYGDRDTMVSHAARMAGWLDVLTLAIEDGRAREYRLVFRLLGRTTSARGVNSPRSVVDLHHLVDRFPTPGRLQRWLGRAARKADALLAPWRQHASWDALAEAASSGSARPRRAALRAAAATLAQAADRRGIRPPPALSRPADCRAFLARMRGLLRLPSLQEVNGLAAARARAVAAWVSWHLGRDPGSTVEEVLDSDEPRPGEEATVQALLGGQVHTLWLWPFGQEYPVGDHRARRAALNTDRVGWLCRVGRHNIVVDPACSDVVGDDPAAAVAAAVVQYRRALTEAVARRRAGQARRAQGEPSGDGEALLRGLLAIPWNRVDIRLTAAAVYADWLEENGRPQEEVDWWRHQAAYAV